MDKYKFGDYIYNKRKKLGLTQEELGRLLGVTNKAVSKWEVGETMPDIMMLKSLAKALGITVDELLTQQDKPQEDVVESKNEEKKSNKLLYIFIVTTSILSIIIVVFLSLYLSTLFISEEQTLMKVSNENIQEVININPSSQIICNEETLEIQSTYKLNENFSLQEDN